MLLCRTSPRWSACKPALHKIHVCLPSAVLYLIRILAFCRPLWCGKLSLVWPLENCLGRVFWGTQNARTWFLSCQVLKACPILPSILHALIPCHVVMMIRIGILRRFSVELCYGSSSASSVFLWPDIVLVYVLYLLFVRMHISNGCIPHTPSHSYVHVYGLRFWTFLHWLSREALLRAAAFIFIAYTFLTHFSNILLHAKLSSLHVNYDKATWLHSNVLVVVFGQWWI